MNSPLPTPEDIDEFEYIETSEDSKGIVSWKFYDHSNNILLLEPIQISSADFDTWRRFNISKLVKEWIRTANKLNIKYKREGFDTVNIGELNIDSIINKTTSNIYAGGYYKLWRAILNEILYKVDNVNNDLSSRARYWLKQLVPLSSGAYGITLKSGVIESKSIYVLKYSVGDKSEVIHETAIGYALNTLREKNLTLNYVYTYGIFDCATPLIQLKSGENPIMTWCRQGPDENITNYLVIENIPESITLASAIASSIKTPSILSIDQLISIILQVIMASYVAHTELYFTHWDLHCSNILLRKVPAEKILTYQFSNMSTKYYVVTHGYIITIIDYGMASAKINDKIIASKVHGATPDITSYAKYGVINFYQDIFRFLIELYINYLPNNSSSFNEFIYDILNIMFKSTTPIPFIKERGIKFGTDRFETDKSVIYANIPPDIGNSSIKEFIDQFNDVLKKYNPQVFSRTFYYETDSINATNILSCSSSESYCPTVSEIVRSNSIPLKDAPTTVKEYYERNIKLKPDSEDISDIDKDFSFEVNSLLGNITSLSRSISTKSLNNMIEWARQLVSTATTLSGSAYEQLNIIDNTLFDVLKLKLLLEELEFMTKSRYEIGGNYKVLSSFTSNVLNHKAWNNVLNLLEISKNIASSLLSLLNKYKLPKGHIIPDNLYGFIYILNKPISLEISL